jgi:phage terminase large subunit
MPEQFNTYITVRPTKKQDLVYQALRLPQINTVFFGGGAGGGKSWILCESRLQNAIRFPGYKSFIGREELKRLMQSTYVTWTKVCSYHKVDPRIWHLNGQYNYIEFNNGSRIDLLDLKFLPADPMYERFGSLEYTDGAIEEAGEIDFLAFDVLKSRIGRHMNKDFGLHPSIFITGNPKKNWTYTEFYKPWKNKTLPANAVFIQSLYMDNPHTATEYGQQLAGIKDTAMRERLMMGNWEYEDDPSALIQFDAINDMFSNSVPFDEQKYLTADVARYGSDKCVIYCWKGWEAYKVLEFSKSSVDATARRIRDLLLTERIPRSHAIVDDDGVGGGVVDIL